tara:strand:+ start:293 stop:637 length:345 start_codon:yes stop_codon:yes gene_type:complete
MGLDQFAGVRVDADTLEELACWRKHPNLQGWMRNLWQDKHPDDEREFNCVDVELTLEDIEQLEGDVLEGRLPTTGGFFFGENADDHYKEADLEFCKNARKALEDGLQIVYNSWW